MELNVNFDRTIGKIKPMHAVGQPPLCGARDTYFHYLKEANIPYSRLHDVGGAYGGSIYVDIPNLFRNFDADENDPTSYDFAFTDFLLKSLQKQDCEPIYRLGITIENYPYIKDYRLDPPSDFGKWARICEHVIRHYNEGWANGFHMGITYWEIWNEPDITTNRSFEPRGTMMWKGTFEQYYELYVVAASHLKQCFGESIKVGGPASCGFYSILHPDHATTEYVRFAKEFLQYVKDHKAPLDFFSWHSYASAEDTVLFARYARNLMDEYGFTNAESHLNEWNNAASLDLRGTSAASARAADMILRMQNEKVDVLCYYDARLGPSVYGGLFNPMTHKPVCTYYTFVAFGKLYAMGTQVEVKQTDATVSAVAAKGESGKGILLTNTANKNTDITIPNAEGMKLYLIDENHFLTPTNCDPTHFTLIPNQTALLLQE